MLLSLPLVLFVLLIDVCVWLVGTGRVGLRGNDVDESAGNSAGVEVLHDLSAVPVHGS
jgi:hypothetical protein